MQKFRNIPNYAALTALVVCSVFFGLISKRTPDTAGNKPAVSSTETVGVLGDSPGFARVMPRVNSGGTKKSPNREVDHELLAREYGDDHAYLKKGLHPDSIAMAPTFLDNAEDNLMEEAFQELREGKLILNAPKKMQTAHTSKVSVNILSGSKPDTAAMQRFLKRGGTTTEIESLKISTKMKMTLVSADFEVTPLNHEEQSVGGSSGTNWEWTIFPKRAGVLHLHLTATVEVGDLSKDFTSEDRDVEVTVDKVDWIEGVLKSNLAVVWSILTAVCTWFAARKFFQEEGIDEAQEKAKVRKQSDRAGANKERRGGPKKKVRQRDR
jgi:hypothetical protein